MCGSKNGHQKTCSREIGLYVQVSLLFYFFILGHKLKIQLQEICSSVVNCFKFNSEHNCVDLYEYVKKENLHLHIE